METKTLISSSLLNEMKSCAAGVHADVNQKYGEHEYSYHIFSVADEAMRLISILYPELQDKDLFTVIIFGALFHDSIEDARLSYNDVHKIALSFTPEPYATAATEIVYALTNEKGRTRAERANDKYYDGIRNTRFAVLVKLADRIANMKYSRTSKSSMYQKYIQEADHFLLSLAGTDYVLLEKMKQIIADVIQSA